MEHSYRFFENQQCKYFPCHKGMHGEEFNCLFCYCPLNPYPDCPGKPLYRDTKEGNRIKDCSDCTFPHEPDNYEKVIAFLKEKLYEK